MIEQSLTERERSLIAQHLEKELYYARFLLQEQRYEEAAAAFEQVAKRCRSIAEDTP